MVTMVTTMIKNETNLKLKEKRIGWWINEKKGGKTPEQFVYFSILFANSLKKMNEYKREKHFHYVGGGGCWSMFMFSRKDGSNECFSTLLYKDDA